MGFPVRGSLSGWWPGLALPFQLPGWASAGGATNRVMGATGRPFVRRHRDPRLMDEYGPLHHHTCARGSVTVKRVPRAAFAAATRPPWRSATALT